MVERVNCDGCPSCGNPIVDDVGELCAECYQTQGE